MKEAPAHTVTRGTAVLLIAATVLGFGLRLNRIDRLGLETDEGLYSAIASLPLRTLPVYLSGHESTPPLFLVLLKIWQTFFASDVGLRLLPVLLGTAAIPAMFVAGRGIFGPGAGLASAFFLAVSPFHLRFSRIAKNPSLFFLLTLCALLCLLSVAQGRARRRTWVGLSVALAGMLYAHGLAPVFVAGLAAFFVLFAKDRWRVSFRPWLAAHAVAVILFLPWAGIAAQQANETLANFWAPRPSIAAPLVSAANFTLLRPNPPLVRAEDLPVAGPFLASRPAALAAAGRALSWTWFLPAAAALALSAWLLVRTGRQRTLWALAALYVVPVGIVWLASRVTASIYIDRALMPALIPIPLLFGAPFGILAEARKAAEGRAAIPRRGTSRRIVRWATAASATTFAVLLVCSWRVAVAGPGEQWREAAAAIRERARDGDALVFDAHFGEILLDRYLGEDARRFPAYGLPVRVRDMEVPDWKPRVDSDLDLAPLVEAASSHPALWLVLSHTEIHDRRGLAAEWCNERLTQTEVHRFVGVVVARYETGGGAAPSR